MSAPISYNTKRGVIFYTPSSLANTEPEIARFPLPLCQPRTRRLHSIQIIRLPTPSNFSGKRRISRGIDFSKITPFKTAKRLLKSIISSFDSKASVEADQTKNSSSKHSETTPSCRSEQSRFTGFGISRQEPDIRRQGSSSFPIFSYTTMSRSSIGGSSWRPTFNIDASSPRNSISTAAPRSGMIGISRPTASQKSVPETEKPLVSGNEVSCSIILAEPVIFLMGLEHDGSTRDSNGSNATAILRGTLRLNVTKNVKIKAVSLKFSGRARTLWPEGIPPHKQETVEECSLRTQVLPFFNALHKGSESGYGNLCTYTLRDSKSTISSNVNSIPESLKQPSQVGFSLSGITNRANRLNSVSSISEGRRISVPSIQLKSHQKGESAHGSVQSKGYKIFYPGIYDYSFELPIDNKMPETTDLPLASVKWELEATVERAGTFKANLVGRKEVPVVRLPSQDSLELVEPIAVSRTWDQQLHYDIVISGKSFPIGTKIPIAFKLTPLAKVQVHKVKIFLTENIEYFAKDKSVQRKDVKRRMLLLEKTAGKPVAKEFWPSEVIIVGGESLVQDREMRRSMAMRRRELEAQQNNTNPVPLPDHVENLLGDIDLGVEEWWGPTEIEMNAQIPTCQTMEKDRSKRLAHDCTWSNVHVNHWLKILIRLSRADTDDPSKRRHYEISVDSPISLLNCRASQANISLPEYSRPVQNTEDAQQVCGCMNSLQTTEESAAKIISGEIESTSNNLASSSLLPKNLRPTLSTFSMDMSVNARRPVHLLRSPSFQPPPFDAEEPPPPFKTPPPLYDNVIGTPSHDGLADYFVRLGEYEGELPEDEESIHPVNHNCVSVTTSRTSSDRFSTIMDLDRNFIFGTNGTSNVMVGSNTSVPAP